MKPYYHDENSGITIYHGDCREVLPTLAASCADLVVTDPPFSVPANISASRRMWPRSLGNLAIMDSYFRDTFREMRRVLKEIGALYTFCDSTSYAVFMASLYPLFDRTQSLVWDKGAGGLGNGWRHAHELLIHGASSATVYADGFRKDVISCRTIPSKERDHASEKPAEVLRTLLTAHPRMVSEWVPALVVDPFMGSGATMEAAKLLGWRGVGVEVDEAYCEIAAKRLQQSVLALGAV